MLTRDQVLRAIHDLQVRTPAGVARTSDLAAQLGVTGPSVTARVQELAAAGLVRYVPRKGAALTAEGEHRAVEAAARLRLIERFLAGILRLPADAIAGESELFARYASDRVMDGIARFLASADK
jgi:DtxR family Mn-dependent transcriptional regulator